MGAAYLLPRVVGLGHASELLFTGDIIDAERARAIGLVNRVAPTDEALAEFLSTLWYRAVFAIDPPQHRHEAGRALRALAGLPAGAR